MPEVYDADAGGVQVLHALATTDDGERLTPRELASRLDTDHSWVQRVCLRLTEAGYVSRRRRVTFDPGKGPYEYAVAPADESAEAPAEAEGVA